MHDTEVEDAELLRRFVSVRAEDAFAELVRRHLGLVYGAALRQLGGDAHLAQDVAQLVFTDLARKASALTTRDTLAGWLHTSTHHAAANVVRAERRRRKREEEAYAMEELSKNESADNAWAQVRPVLDDALQELRPADRDAILLRFFEGRDFADLGARFSVSESGARMRVERALDQLRAKLERRGIRSTMAALGAALATHAAAAPPVGLAAAITSTALAGSAAAATGGAFLTFLGMTKIQVATIAVFLVSGSATLVWQQREQSSMRAEIQSSRDELIALTQTPATSTAFERAPTARVETRDTTNELMALRAEKAALVARMQQFPPLPTARAATSVVASTPPVVNGPVFRLNEVDIVPKPTKQLPPRYPIEMKNAGIPGDALISFVLTADGTVTDLAPEDATHPIFAMAAMDAMAGWTFTPAQKAGMPVNVRMQQPMQFRLDDPNWISP